MASLVQWNWLNMYPNKCQAKKRNYNFFFVFVTVLTVKTGLNPCKILALLTGNTISIHLNNLFTFFSIPLLRKNPQSIHSCNNRVKLYGTRVLCKYVSVPRNLGHRGWTKPIILYIISYILKYYYTYYIFVRKRNSSLYNFESPGKSLAFKYHFTLLPTYTFLKYCFQNFNVWWLTFKYWYYFLTKQHTMICLN